MKKVRNDFITAFKLVLKSMCQVDDPSPYTYLERKKNVRRGLQSRAARNSPGLITILTKGLKHSFKGHRHRSRRKGHSSRRRGRSSKKQRRSRRQRLGTDMHNIPQLYKENEGPKHAPQDTGKIILGKVVDSPTQEKPLMNFLNRDGYHKNPLEELYNIGCVLPGCDPRVLSLLLVLNYLPNSLKEKELELRSAIFFCPSIQNKLFDDWKKRHPTLPALTWNFVGKNMEDFEWVPVEYGNWYSLFGTKEQKKKLAISMTQPNFLTLMRDYYGFVSPSMEREMRKRYQILHRNPGRCNRNDVSIINYLQQ